MTDFNALLRAVISAPDEDTPRVVMADWFQDNGQPERAEFIRVQVELANHGWNESRRKNPAWACFCASVAPGHHCSECLTKVKEWIYLHRRERQLLIDHGHHWFESVFPSMSLGKLHETGHRWVWWPGNNRAEGDISRGFVSSLTCTAADWLQHADAIYWHPEQEEDCDSCSGIIRGDCLRCGGSGKVERPCPDTAQPLRKVVLTTYPELTIGWVTTSREGNIWRIAKWPGIEFELPPEPIPFRRGEIMTLPTGARFYRNTGTYGEPVWTPLEAPDPNA